MEDSLDIIALQKKTQALTGVIECFWFENSHIGLANTLFHKISIPLASFDSGLDYEEQPVETSIEFDWYNLNLPSPEELDNLDLSHDNYVDAEASLYLGSAHNWCHVVQLEIKKLSENLFTILGEVKVEFENEGVGQNETFKFAVNASYKASL